MQSDSTTTSRKPARKFEDLSGKVFHAHTVDRFSHITDRYVRYWVCYCICGRERVLPEHHIKSGLACKECRRLATLARITAKKLANHRETNLEYLKRVLAETNFDFSLPWNSYPCMDWPFGVSKAIGEQWNYGIININNRQYRVSRVVFEMFHGPLPKERHALHFCDRPICFSPAHLFSGSPADNAHDAMAKKRHCFGTRNGNAIITDEVAAEVLRLYAMGIYKQTEIGRMTNVGKHSVWMIVHKKHWKHVTT